MSGEERTMRATIAAVYAGAHALVHNIRKIPARVPFRHIVKSHFEEQTHYLSK